MPDIVEQQYVVGETLNMTLHISTKIKDKWAVLPKQWVVEQTFAWLNNFRRLAKNFENLTATSENMIRIAMLKLTVAKCVCVFTRLLLSIRTETSLPSILNGYSPC